MLPGSSGRGCLSGTYLGHSFGMSSVRGARRPTDPEIQVSTKVHGGAGGHPSRTGSSSYLAKGISTQRSCPRREVRSGHCTLPHPPPHPSLFPHVPQTRSQVIAHWVPESPQAPQTTSPAKKISSSLRVSSEERPLITHIPCAACKLSKKGQQENPQKQPQNNSA